MAAGFDDYYRGVYGARWPGLRAAMERPGGAVLRWNGFASPQSPSRALTPHPSIEGAFTANAEYKPAPAANGLLDAYPMDAASILVARALSVQEGDRTLDLCAAPGGKSLILAEAIGARGRLVLNDASRARAKRLQSVLEQYLPSEVRERIRVTVYDGRRWGLYESSAFDRILLDAPCSSERHLLAKPQELKKWSPARTRQLALRQYALLCSALLAAKPGAAIVYSTCSLSPGENDAVIARALERKKGWLAVEPFSDIPLGEATRFGWRILPDRDDAGPMYFCRLRRLDASPIRNQPP